MAKLRGGLIGCGYFGQIQLEAWRRMEGAEIVAACDGNLERARSSAAAAYGDAREMLEREQLDFVDVATRPDTHLELVRLAVSCGKPVMVQKPLAPDLAGAREILAVASAAGARVMVHENWRWQPWHREMKRRLEQGDVGDVFGYHLTMMAGDGLGPTPYPAQPYFATMPKLLMFESLIHPVDVGRFYCGEIERVYAVTRRRNPLIVGEDRAVLTLSHADVDGVVEGHRYLASEPPGPGMGRALVEGEKGRLEALADGRVYWNGRLVWECPELPGYKGDSVKATQEHFVECLRTGEEFETSVARYWGSFAAVEAAYESARLGRAVGVSELAG
jgi:predicted dehydrogenase